MKEEVINSLYGSFELKERRGLGGMTFKYVPSTDIVDRMNRVFNGNWSTEVVSQERADDFIVVRVRVTAFDSETGRVFSHDGYGSSLVARYSEGQKSGQVIDLGNAYKSAEAKAIKNACTRWGVGLYLENIEEEGGPFTAHTEHESKPAPKTQKDPVRTTGNTPPPFPSRKDAGTPPPSPQTTPPVKSVPKTTNVENKPANKPTEIMQESGAHKITDVQKVAIQGLLQIKKSLFGDIPENMRFSKLVSDALGRAENLPKKPEDLSYQDAVTVIKYGNDIDKK